jgi:tol-pal system protein YbgF
MRQPYAGPVGRFPLCQVGGIAIACAVALVAGCATTPAADDPVQVKLNDIDARVTRIERIISNQSLVELAQHLDAVQSDVRQLRGRVEELEYKQEGMRKQQIAAGGGSSGPAPGAGSAAGAAGATGAAAGGVAPTAPTDAGTGGGTTEEQTVYAQSFDALKAGSYSTAITGFKAFLTSYPASPLAENAQYWLGEAYYVTRDFEGATTAFRSVVQKYPNSRKAPDALLKLGYTQLEQKKVAEGRATLSQVIQKYPGTDAARLATDKLQRAPAK